MQNLLNRRRLLAATTAFALAAGFVAAPVTFSVSADGISIKSAGAEARQGRGVDDLPGDDRGRNRNRESSSDDGPGDDHGGDRNRNGGGHGHDDSGGDDHGNHGGGHDDGPGHQ